MYRTGLVLALAALCACHAAADWSFRVTVGPDGGMITSGVLVTPSTAHVGFGRQVLFSANVVGTSDTSVTWSVQEGASGGTVDSTGLYTAPMTAGTYHVVADSHALGVSGSATAVVAAVGSCSALPAKGTWDPASISPVVPTTTVSYQFTGKSTAIVVDPYDASTVWLGTGDKGLFKSTDCGATWSHVNNGTNGGSLDQSVLWSFVIDPVNQGVIYTVAAYGVGGLWKSTNGGGDWQQLFDPNSQFGKLVPYNFVANVSMDPSNPKHLAVTSHGKCNDPYPNGCIAETFDGGATWPNIVGMPQAWGEDGGIQVINATTWIWGTGDNFGGTYVTTDNGKNWTQALPGHMGDATGENTTQPLVRAADGAYYSASLQGALRSTDGASWTLAWGQKNFMTPQAVGLIVTPNTIYSVANTAFFSAPLNDYGNWSAMKAPPLAMNDYAAFLAYDVTHHVLYVSCWGSVFRFVDG
jgi:hypothetical protein